MNVSVALCTYNGEKYLREQLDSYAAQAYPVNELVVCDDRSIDATVDILADFAKVAPFTVRIIINERSLGARSNFEKAIGLCTGDLIFFSDQDDIWPEQKTAEFISYAKAQPDMLGFFSDAWVLNEEGIASNTLWHLMGVTKKATASLSVHEMCAFLLGRFNLVYGSMTAIRREALALILPFQIGSTGLWHDQWTAISLSAVDKLSFIPKPLLYYRQHSGQEVGLRQLDLHRDMHRLSINLSESDKPGDIARLRMMQYWNAMTRTDDYGALFPALQQRRSEFKQAFIRSRDAFLHSESFLRRKLRIVKWASEKRFGVTYSDILRF